MTKPRPRIYTVGCHGEDTMLGGLRNNMAGLGAALSEGGFWGLISGVRY